MKRGADVASGCTGVNQVLATVIRSARVGGTCVHVAIRGYGPQVPMNDLVFREVGMLGGPTYADDHPATIEMVAGGRVDPFPFITGRIGLEDIIEQGLQELIDNEEENVRILVSPGR